MAIVFIPFENDHKSGEAGYVSKKWSNEKCKWNGTNFKKNVGALITQLFE